MTRWKSETRWYNLKSKRLRCQAFPEVTKVKWNAVWASVQGPTQTVHSCGLTRFGIDIILPQASPTALDALVLTAMQKDVFPEPLFVVFVLIFLQFSWLDVWPVWAAGIFLATGVRGLRARRCSVRPRRSSCCGTSITATGAWWLVHYIKSLILYKQKITNPLKIFSAAFRSFLKSFQWKSPKKGLPKHLWDDYPKATHSWANWKVLREQLKFTPNMAKLGLYLHRTS